MYHNTDFQESLYDKWAVSWEKAFWTSCQMNRLVCIPSFKIFQKVIFCLALYTEVNLWIFFHAKPFVVTTYAKKVLF